MHALVDGDILLYKVGYTTQVEDEETALLRMDENISGILDAVAATEHSIFLSCGRKDSFRAKLNPQYKAHRTQEKPVHYQALKNHLITNWKAQVAIEEEADDLIGIALKSLPNTIACTIDKDILFGLAGQKFDFGKGKMFYTLEEEATFFFYKQLLMGDKADNILGIPGIGPAKSAKALDPYYGEDELVLYEAVVDKYREWLSKDKEDWSELDEKAMLDLITLSGKQLKIRTSIGEIWEPPYDNTSMD